MKNAGPVLTRFHWQQDEKVLDLCDELGLLVQEEIPLWGAATPLDDEILAIARQHLDERTRLYP